MLVSSLGTPRLAAGIGEGTGTTTADGWPVGLDEESAGVVGCDSGVDPAGLAD